MTAGFWGRNDGVGKGWRAALLSHFHSTNTLPLPLPICVSTLVDFLLGCQSRLSLFFPALLQGRFSRPQRCLFVDLLTCTAGFGTVPIMRRIGVGSKRMLVPADSWHPGWVIQAPSSLRFIAMSLVCDCQGREPNQPLVSIK